MPDSIVIIYIAIFVYRFLNWLIFYFIIFLQSSRWAAIKALAGNTPSETTEWVALDHGKEIVNMQRPSEDILLIQSGWESSGGRLRFS